MLLIPLQLVNAFRRCVVLVSVHTDLELHIRNAKQIPAN
jgi:hypothetical protein